VTQSTAEPRNPAEEVVPLAQNPPPQGLAPKPKRVVSIDALRGFDMFWLIGGTAILHPLLRWVDAPWAETLEAQLEHTSWHGFTFYDLIFPLFLFIVGASLPFALRTRIERGADKGELFKHIARRGLTLIVFGWIYSGFLDFELENFRWMGVLQRIGLCYFFAATIVLFTDVRGQAIAFVAILLGYWGLMTLVPVPGIGAGVLTPEGNLSGFLDRLILPGRFCCDDLYDNEGLLSTLPAIGTSLLGVLSGQWLRSGASGNRKVLGLLGSGIASLLLARLWNPWFPINKLMWTSSYVLFAGGWSLLLLGFFYLVVDVWEFRSWSFFFVVIGMNAITIYLGQRIIPFQEMAEFFFSGIASFCGGLDKFVLELGELGLKWGFLYFLYRQRIFLKA
jgi:predicted acyltransferase